MILGIDTSTGTSVALVDEDGRVVAEAIEPGLRGHAERIGALIQAVLTGVGPSAVTAVAVGMGPGPYTGLRVGIAAATAFAVGRGAVCHGVPSHDAIRAELGLAPSIPVATAAGRRGHYVSEAGELRLSHDGIDDALLVDRVSAAAVAQVALARLRAGLPTGPSGAIYLREPDVQPPSPRKRAS